MKRLPNAVVYVGFLVISGLVILGTLFLSNHFLIKSNVSKSSVVDCQKIRTRHQVIVRNGVSTPRNTYAHLCDSLTITNRDSQVRLMAFGPHEEHQIYDGVTEKKLRGGQSLTVTLNQTGAYQFHDHLGDVAQGDFTVARL